MNQSEDGDASGRDARKQEYSTWWHDHPLWTLSEAALLLTNFYPSALGPLAPKDIDRLGPATRRVYAHLHSDLIEGRLPSCKSEFVNEPLVRGGDVVSWAIRKGFDIPAEVRELAETSKPEEGQDAKMNTKEKDSLLKLVLAMAVRKYGYDPNALKNDAIKKIGADLDKEELKLDDDTIRKWLKEAADRFARSSVGRNRP